MIKKYIKLICEILSIKEPPIQVDASVFENSTALAYFDTENKILLVPNSPKPSFDTFFALAHELRHAWQIKTNYLLYFSNYKTRKELSVKEYNSQLAEIDANAFAHMIVTSFFGVEPLYKGLDDEVKGKIKSRTNELMLEYRRFLQN